MSWWKLNRSRREQAHTGIAAARAALAVTINERGETRALKADAERTSEEFAARAITLREIRQRNHITPSLFPPQERSQ